MKFLNRKGEEVDFQVATNTRSEAPIFAQSGAGQSAALKTLSGQERKAILDNTTTKIFVKT